MNIKLLEDSLQPRKQECWLIQVPLISFQSNLTTFCLRGFYKSYRTQKILLKLNFFIEFSINNLE
jgi:hypothetical protein